MVRNKSYPQDHLIAQKYRVERLLGSGSFSHVYLVADGTRTQALKLLKKNLSGEAQAQSLTDFATEFTILKNLHHPHIARILDFGLDETTREIFFTSEYISGPNIFDATQGLGFQQQLDLFLQILRALRYIHDQRVLHLDLKPANILVAQNQNLAKIIDFGLSALAARNLRVGTPATMAPEIISGESPDHRADLYSLGVVIYTCITRSNPFLAASVAETLKRHTGITPPRPSSLAGSPDYLDGIVMKMLEKRPSLRYQNVQEVLRDIQGYAPESLELETKETLIAYLPRETRFIGRKDLWSLLKGYLDQLISGQQNTPQLCSVRGAPGTGKSRLLKELKYQSQIMGLHTISLDWDQTGVEHDLPTDLAKGTRSLILIDNFKEQSPQSALEGLRHFLNQLDERDRGSTMLVITSVQALSPAWSIYFDESNCLELTSFTQDELVEYLITLTGLAQPPTDLIAGLLAMTEGNPLLVTETLRSLIEKGALFDRNGRWNSNMFEDVGVDLSQAEPLDALDRVFWGRLHTLSLEEQDLLHFLSLSPQPLTLEQLAMLHGGPITAAIDGLRKNGVISRLDTNGAYALSSAAFAQFVRTTASITETAQLHDQLAALVDTNSRLYHEMRGSDLELALNRVDEVIALWSESSQARKIVTLLEEVGPRLHQARPEVQLSIDLRLAEAQLILMDHEGADQTATRIADMIHTLSDPQSRAKALIRLGAVAFKLDKLQKAEACFTEAATHPAPIEALIAQNWLATLARQRGDFVVARQQFQNNYQAWLKLSETDRRLVTNNDLGMVLMGLRQHHEAQRQFLRDLDFFSSLNDALLLARVHYNLAENYAVQGNLTKAIVHYESCLSYARSTRHTPILLHAFNGLGNLYALLNQTEQSLSHFERALSLCTHAEDRTVEAGIRVNLGIMHGKIGDQHRSNREIRHAIKILRLIASPSSMDRQILCRALIELAELEYAQGHQEQARSALDKAQIISGQTDGVLNFWIQAMEIRINKTSLSPGTLLERVSALESAARTKEEQYELEKLRQDLVQKPEAPMEDDMDQAYAHILRINKFINQETDLDFVLKTVLLHALELCSAESGLILLLDSQGTLTIQASVNANTQGAEMSFSTSIAQQAIREGRLIRTHDALQDERFAAQDSVMALALKSVLCMPITSRQQTIGALYLEHRFRKNLFEKLNESLLEAFAEQAGIAIGNARLLQSYRKENAQMAEHVSNMSLKLDRAQHLIDQRLAENSLFERQGLIGQSEQMKKIFQLMEKIADTDLSVFIYGESGTGKEVLARTIHQMSSRRKDPFVPVNCGAIPANLIESELFGYRAGAFSGATRDKRGLIEEASGGTLFLDEIGELELSLQVKLLRVLQENEIRRVGDTKDIKVNLRVLAASNKDIETLANKQLFREDLYYRLCQIRLDLPALRERLEDIPLLIEHLLKRHSKKKLRPTPRLMQTLLNYDWPGNIRELENLIKVAMALSDGHVIDITHIPSNHRIHKQIASSARSVEEKTAPSMIMIDSQNSYRPDWTWNNYERIIMARALAYHHNHVKETAKKLGIAATTLYKRIKTDRLADTKTSMDREAFHYDGYSSLEQLRPRVFRAALQHAGGKVYRAIEQLGVSPGYYYKVMQGSN